MAKEENLKAIFDGVMESVEASGLDRALVAGLCKDLERSKFKMIRCYDNVREHVKSKYMRDSDARMDRHKVIACVMASVLNGLDLAESGRVGADRHLKELVAIKVGLSLLRTWVGRDNEGFKNGGLIAFLDRRDGFVLPPPICDDKAYVKNWVLELHYNQRSAVECGGNLPILSMADKLFWVESYNRALAGGAE